MGSDLESSDLSASTPPRRSLSLLVWIMAGTVWVLVLFVVGIELTVPTIDLSRFAAPAVAAVRRETGRDLTIGRGPFLRVSLSPAVVAENVTFTNATWGSRKEMLRVKRVELTLRLFPLLHGEILVGRLLLVEPDLLLETNERGEGNWALASAREAGPAEKPGGEGASFARLGIREARVTDALLAYRDGCAGWRASVVVPHLSLVSGRTMKSDLDVDAAVALDRTTVSVSGTIGGLEAMLGSRPFPIKLALSIHGAIANLEGTIKRVRDLAGVDLKAILDVSDPPALAGSLGATAPRLAPFRIECQVRDSGKGWALDPVRVTSGRNSLSGSVGYVMGCPHSRITLDLRAPLLDLRELTGAGKGAETTSKPKAAKGAKLFSTRPLALDALRAFDGNADLRVESLVLAGGAEVQAFAVRAVLANGRLTVDPASLTLGGGRITGSLRVDAGRRQAFTANLTGNGVELRALLELLGAQAGVSGGPTELRVALAGSGASLHEWMAALSGSVRVVVAQARLESKALGLGSDVFTQAAAAVNPAHARERATELRCAVINVLVEQGVVHLDHRVAAETSEINLVVGGTVDLGAETLDVGFRSKATQGLGVGLANFAGLARIQGSLVNPTLGLDAKGAVAAASTVDSAVRTRGRSLVQQRILDVLFPESPCKDALSKTESKRFSPLKLFRQR
jgi:uncharacterized protein involved in outer membrane biogenesis